MMARRRGASSTSRLARCDASIVPVSPVSPSRSRCSRPYDVVPSSPFYSYALIKMPGRLMVRVLLSRARIRDAPLWARFFDRWRSSDLIAPVKSMFAISFTRWFIRANIMTAVSIVSGTNQFARVTERWRRAPAGVINRDWTWLGLTEPLVRCWVASVLSRAFLIRWT